MYKDEVRSLIETISEVSNTSVEEGLVRIFLRDDKEETWRNFERKFIELFDIEPTPCDVNMNEWFFSLDELQLND